MVREGARSSNGRLCLQSRRPDPDFIPVLGYLDDLIIVPLGIAVSIRLIPDDVMSECRARAVSSLGGDNPVSRTAAVVVVLIWLVAVVLIGRIVIRG